MDQDITHSPNGVRKGGLGDHKGYVTSPPDSVPLLWTPFSGASWHSRGDPLWSPSIPLWSPSISMALKKLHENLGVGDGHICYVGQGAIEEGGGLVDVFGFQGERGDHAQGVGAEVVE